MTNVSEDVRRSGEVDLYLVGDPVPRDAASLGAAAPRFLRRLERALAAEGLPGTRPLLGTVHLDPPRRARVAAPWYPREVDVVASRPFSDWRLDVAVDWLPEEELLDAAYRRTPRLDQAAFRAAVPSIEPELQRVGTELSCWIGRRVALGGVGGFLGALGRFTELVTEENLGAFESALARGAIDAAPRWLEAEGLANLSPRPFSGALVRVAREFVALRAASGSPLAVELDAERLAGMLALGVPHRQRDEASRLWQGARSWAEGSADPEAVAYAELLGRAMAASVPEQFLSSVSPVPERAGVYALSKALGRARALLDTWEPDPAAAEARWGELLHV